MSPGNDRGAPRQESATTSNQTNTSILLAPAPEWDGAIETVDDWEGAYLSQHIARIIVEALQTATAAYWRRRADEFKNAMPREGDFRGRVADDAGRRMLEKARACHHAAEYWNSIHTGERPRLWCIECWTFTSPWTCSCGATRVGGAE